MANININIWWRANCQNVDINTAKYFQGKANSKSSQLKSERDSQQFRASRCVCVCDWCVFVCLSCLPGYLCACVCPLCMWSLSIGQPQTHSHTHPRVLSHMKACWGNCFMALAGHTNESKSWAHQKQKQHEEQTRWECEH